MQEQTQLIRIGASAVPDVIAERGRLVPSHGLSLVHGEVCGHYQTFTLGAVDGVLGDPEADCNRNRLVVLPGEAMTLNGQSHPLSNGHRLREDSLWEYERKLLPAIACDHIDVPQFGNEDLGDLLQHHVADRVAMGVVEHLELVDIQHYHGQWTVEPL